MKSIIQEAASVAKAVEQGWEKAGKPAEFTVRILEEPVKNFFGFTTRSAKIALLFAPEQRSGRNQSKQSVRQSVSGAGDRRTDRGERQERSGSRSFEPGQERRPFGQRHEQRSEHRQDQRPEQRSEQRQEHARPSFSGQSAGQDNRTLRGERPAHMGTKTHHKVRDEEVFHDREDEGGVEPQGEGNWTPDMVTYVRSWLTTALQLADKDGVTFTVEPQRFHLRITFNKALLQVPDREKQLFASLALILLHILKSHFRVPLRGHKIVLTHASQ